MAREGRQRPNYGEEERYYDRDRDLPAQESRWREREPDWETRERLERYFSEQDRPYEGDRPYREHEWEPQMQGRGSRPDWNREDFERSQREHRAREGYGRREQYGYETEQRPGGYLPEQAREEHGRRFRPDFDWEREDFEHAKREHRGGREGYSREERFRTEPEPRDWRYPEGEREELRKAWDWRMRGPYAGRGPRGYRRSDESIYEDVCECLMQDGQIDARNIEVEVRNAIVMLRGAVDNRQTKYMAEDVSQSVFGVKDVRNELRIDPSIRTEESRPTTMTHGMLRRGMEVLDRKGNSVGQVKEMRDNDFLLDRRMQRDIYVPVNAVDRIDKDVVLNIDKDRMDDMGWQKPEWTQTSR